MIIFPLQDMFVGLNLFELMLFCHIGQDVNTVLFKATGNLAYNMSDS